MTLASVACFAAVAAGAGLRDHPPLLQFGADPAPGILVNRTIGCRPFDPPDRQRPTLIFVHGFNPTPQIVHFTMTERLAEAAGRRFGAGLNVLGWEWNAATLVSMSPDANREETIHQGHRLAASMIAAGVDPGRTQLIGHSSGTIVVAAAARELLSRYGRGLAQLTLLETAASYHSIVFGHLAAGTAARVVENYWVPGPSAFGRAAAYAGVRNCVAPSRSPYFGLVCPLRSDHLYVVRWYLATVSQPNASGGFNTSVLVGLAR
jgi:pimeloyl-ACP methyl ester carboxylesterase